MGPAKARELAQAEALENAASQSAFARTRAGFAANSRAVQYHYVQFLTEHLVDCSRSFDGDLDQVILMAVLGQRFIDAANREAADSEAAQEMIWMSARRLADLTNLPRETVRRKLKALEARGWVSQDADKGWSIAGSFEGTVAREDLAALDARSMQRLAKLYVVLDNLMKGEA